MSLLDSIRVTISLVRAALTASGFGIPLILGSSQRIAARHQSFASLSEMLDAGYLAADPEYVAAQALLSQTKRPRTFVVGRRLAAVAQVVTVEVTTLANSTAYAITISRTGRTPVVYTYNSDADATELEIRDGLIALIEADANMPVTAAIGDATSLTLTADVAGESFETSVTANLTAEVTEAGHGPAEDLDEITDADAAWYCTILASRVVAEIIEVARWTQSASPRKIFLAQSSDAAAPADAYDSATPDDVAEILRALGYSRTALFWHDDDAERVDAAVAGKMLPERPGSETWAHKELVGVTPTLGVGAFAALAMPSSQRGNLLGSGSGPGGKNANIYYQVTADVSTTWRGTMASGNWIDEIRFVDWLEAEMAARLYTVQLQNPKIPFTDAGIQMLAAQVLSVLQAAEDTGGIASDPKFTVSAPRASEVSAANRAARVLNPPITFGARLAGAVHEIEIEGSVSA